MILKSRIGWILHNLTMAGQETNFFALKIEQNFEPQTKRLKNLNNKKDSFRSKYIKSNSNSITSVGKNP